MRSHQEHQLAQENAQGCVTQGCARMATQRTAQLVVFAHLPHLLLYPSSPPFFPSLSSHYCLLVTHVVWFGLNISLSFPSSPHHITIYPYSSVFLIPPSLHSHNHIPPRSMCSTCNLLHLHPIPHTFAPLPPILELQT